MEKMLPSVDDVTFWLLVNVILFLYVGLEQLIHGYGLGSYLSAGGVLLAVIYLMLMMSGQTHKKMANQWVLIFSGLAVLGDLVAIAYYSSGYFTGDSALLDFAGLMLFHAAYRTLKSLA